MPESPEQPLEIPAPPTESLKNILGKGVQKAQDTIRTTRLKEEFKELGSKGAEYVSSLVGTTRLKEEFKELGSKGAEYVGALATTPIKATWELVRLHPLKATKASAEGLGKGFNFAFGLFSAAASRLPIATAADSLRAIRGAAKLPFKAVGGIPRGSLKALDLFDKGTDKLFDWYKRVQSWDDAGWQFAR